MSSLRARCLTVNGEAVHKDIDEQLAARYPDLALTEDERAALHLLYRAVRQLRREGHNLVEIAAMLGEAIDEEFLGLLDIEVVD
jgi:Trp operon repressor